MGVVEKIKELRKKKGYSQKYMADLLHLSNSGYAKIESGENVLSVERLLDICKILGVTSYNLILPKINLKYTEEIEMVIGGGVISLDNIHRNAIYAYRIVDKLCAKVKEMNILNYEDIIKDLEIIDSILNLISKESMKHGHAYSEVKGFIDNID